MPRYHIMLLVSLLLAVSACTPRNIPTPDEQVVDWRIHSISLEAWPQAEITIDNENQAVSIELPFGSTLSESGISLRLAEGLSSVPSSGEKINLGQFNAIYLSAADGSARKYKVSVSVKASSATYFSSMTETRYYVSAKPKASVLKFKFPYGADLRHLNFNVAFGDGLSFSPPLSDIDLTEDREITVTAADGKTTSKILLQAEFYPKDKGIRGVYLPSPSHTSSFLSYKEVCKSLDLMSSLGFNTLFVCAWAAGKTAWNSRVLKDNSSWETEAAGNMYASYSGGSGDALKDIIATAHQKGIKVILWFEYGFMHNVGGVNRNDPVLAVHPDWLGINSAGEACNYNNNDFYLNGYDPAVQEFMLDMMKEAVALYPELDGIQGDDRLPAMPHDAGYDEATRNSYKAETGREVPGNDNDADWVRWRLDRLNAFAARMHSELKAIRPSLIVCFAPNKYPWCERMLMQDWPGWIADGSVDLLTVQCYVLANYENDVSSTLSYVKANTSKAIFNPAMILKNGASILPVSTIAAQLQYNREVGTFGESQFWFDGLLYPEVQEIFKAYYSYPVPFPEL